MKEKPVFVVLSKEPFEDFRLRDKRWEIRRAKGKWNAAQLRAGRKITLCWAYRRRFLRGVIGKVIFGSLENIFKEVPFYKIEPCAKSRRGAIRENKKLLGKTKKYVAFEVIIEN